ncbi:uncharacterized protein LOC125356795 [Perognathus longimembris pacificus]|uniref:uncharacterized protein LOC125356795 n=1 Tax=Perognathus longimembris pacificus TaxID=214514 RepID=UPI002019A93F|nr:uncharacterized protein LOC125356795 [Perognathus longimembris pacificus]
MHGREFRGSVTPQIALRENPLGRAGAVKESPRGEGGDPPADLPRPDGPSFQNPGLDAALPRHAARKGGSRQPLPSLPPSSTRHPALDPRKPAALSPQPLLSSPLPPLLDFLPGMGDTVDFHVRSVTIGWEPGEVKEFRNLRKAVDEKGPNSSWAHILLRGLNHRLCTAQTWRRVGQLLLVRKEYLKWCASFRNACYAQAENYRAANPPIPITFEMMYGPTNPHVTNFQQVPLPAPCRGRVWALGMWAWRSLEREPPKTPTLEVTQGAAEDLASFVERVEGSLQEKVPGFQLDQLVRSLVWDRMSPDHKLACAGMKDEPLESWIFACRDLSTRTRRTQALTASLDEDPAPAAANEMTGVGGEVESEVTRNRLAWNDPDGNKGEVRPLIMAGLPDNLLGRDSLEKAEAMVSSGQGPSVSCMFISNLVKANLKQTVVALSGASLPSWWAYTWALSRLLELCYSSQLYL